MRFKENFNLVYILSSEAKDIEFVEKIMGLIFRTRIMRLFCKNLNINLKFYYLGKPKFANNYYKINYEKIADVLYSIVIFSSFII